MLGSLAMLLLGAGPAEALDPCRGDRVSPDRFSDRHGTRVGPRLYKDDDGITSRVGVHGLSPPERAAGFAVTWQLADGSRIVLVSTSPAASGVPEPVAPWLGSSSDRWELVVALSSEAVHAMARSPAVALTYDVDGRSVTHPIRRRNARQIQVEYACLANLLAEAR